MIEKIQLLDVRGRQVMGRRVTVRSDFGANVKTVWRKIQDVETLRTICAPMARFIPCDDAPPVWQEGKTMRFKLWLQGLLPLGVHTIYILEMNAATHEIRSEESNRFVPIWKHYIGMEEHDVNTTHYVDVVDLYAGIFTPFMAWWSWRFYKHRQRKWQKIV